VETTWLGVSFLAQIAQKGGDAYDMMGKIIKAEGLFLIRVVLLN
jgi:hypothetical protein